MASADQVKALVRSHGEGDDDRFYSVALQVAAKAARSGQVRFAQELRDLVDAVRETQAISTKLAPVVPVSQPRGELASLLTVSYPSERLPVLTLSASVENSLTTVIREQRARAKLLNHGLSPVHRLLFVGPPGTGKTASSRVLAGELGLPLFVIRLDSLITKFMGETAAKLRLVFDALATMRGVYLFDEVDALAGERSVANDVGEIRRVLNSFLQFLERDDSDSLLVATSNNPQLLDQALFRRFDLVVHFDLPDSGQISEIIENLLTSFNLEDVNWQLIERAAAGLSHADVAGAASTAAKSAILSDRTRLDTDEIVLALEERANRAPHKP